MKKAKNYISIILLVVGICALCLGCMEVVRRIRDTHQTSQIGQEHTANSQSTDVDVSSSESDTSEPESTPASTETVVIGTETTSEVTSENTTESTSESTVVLPEPYVSPYSDYFTKYPDIAAWFQIPDTIIDYPVMWTPEDETYYLYKHYDGSENINGSLLLDTDSSLDPLTTNLIIHGHNMKSGAMFGYLPMYEKFSYYEQHKEMLLYTPDGERTYEIIAVFRSQVFKKKDTCFKYYKFFQANTEEEFKDFYDNIKALSIYDTGVTAEFGDHFITLSTCVSHVENGRFVVVAKEISNTISSE
jgi:sortase B